MRGIVASVLVMTTVTGALAAEGTLSLGKLAGSRQAQIEHGGVILVAGVVVAAGVIALVAPTTQGDTASSTGSSD